MSFKPKGKERVMVAIRLRPQLKREPGDSIQVEVSCKEKQITVGLAGQEQRTFLFDRVFGAHSSQSQVFQSMAFGLVDSVLQGYNATVMAYGMTSSGKTYTMLGPDLTHDLVGIVPRSFQQIISAVQNASTRSFLLRCSFIQVYNQKLRDLLSEGDRMELYEGDQGIYVKGATMTSVRSLNDMLRVMKTGQQRRAKDATALNSQSSRSHAVFSVYVQSKQESGGVLLGKLHMVDLAGSQRLGKTRAEGIRLAQGVKINLSLATLGKVIMALSDKKQRHVPYRDSKLTRLLQDSLGGNSRTLLIATLSPAAAHYQQSLSTLMFSARAQMVTNQPLANLDPKDALLRQYESQIARLKELLFNKRGDEVAIEHEVSRLQDQILHSGQQYEGAIPRDQYLKLKKRAERQREEWALLQEQKRTKEKQLQFMQCNYYSLEGQVQQMRVLLKELRGKYLSTVNEVQIQQRQHYAEKEKLLDSMRRLTKQVEVYQSVVTKLVTTEQMEKIMALAEGPKQGTGLAPGRSKGRLIQLRSEGDIETSRQMQGRIKKRNSAVRLKM